MPTKGFRIEPHIPIMSNTKIIQLLQESENFTKMLLSIIEEGIIICDHGFHIHTWNKFVEEMTGLTAETLHDQLLFHVFPSLAEPQNQALLQRGLLGETVLMPDFVQHSTDGSVKWYRGKLCPHLGTNGENLGAFLVLTNITNEKKSDEKNAHLEDSLQNQRMLAEALGRIIFANTISTNLSSLLELICQECAFLFNANSVQVWLLKDEGLTKIAGYGFQSEPDFVKIPLGNSQHVAVQVVHTKKPYLINDNPLDGDSDFRDNSDGKSSNSLMAVPLMKGQEVIGTLAIEHYSPNEFSTTDLEIALQFGSYASVAVESARLYTEIIQANEKLVQTYDSTLAGWAKALELRDRETEGHTQRVTNGTMKLARDLGLSDDELVHIYRGALLHDIGKMGIPDTILRKPGHLSEQEWAIMRQHPIYAYEWLHPIEYLRPALEIPYSHHEKWDGTGYPQGLTGKTIPLAARIFSVIDVWDALSFDRSYRKAWPQTRVLEYIQSQAGTHFDPEIVDHFMKIYTTL